MDVNVSIFQLVLALYPQTTCFYRALIHEPPSRVSLDFTRVCFYVSTNVKKKRVRLFFRFSFKCRDTEYGGYSSWCIKFCHKKSYQWTFSRSDTIIEIIYCKKSFAIILVYKVLSRDATLELHLESFHCPLVQYILLSFGGFCKSKELYYIVAASGWLQRIIWRHFLSRRIFTTTVCSTALRCDDQRKQKTIRKNFM